MTERNKAMVANQAIPDVEAAAGKIFMRTTLTPETPSPGITDNKNTPISANPNELQSGGLPKNNE